MKHFDSINGKGKDFADSWEQRDWEFAIKSYRTWTHVRMSMALSPRTREHADKRIAELEAKYPQLKKEQNERTF